MTTHMLLQDLNDSTQQQHNLSMEYQIPEGVHAIPHELLDMRPDSEIDRDLLNPKAISGEKNVWFFWHSGFSNMHGYTQRNVRAWHRKLSKLGWTIRVLDREPGSPLNVSHFLDTSDSQIFPQSFVDGKIGGHYGIQHTSDLVRWPLLLKYGGVYADVGFMQIADLNWLWETTVADESSPHEVLLYNIGGAESHVFANYFMASRRDNPLWERCHKLLLELWAADGGKVETDGMHRSPLLKELPLMGEGDDMRFEESGKVYEPEEVSRMLTDYIIQGQAMTKVMGTLDEEDGWNGPKYVAEHVFAMDYMPHSQLINEYTAWDGPRAFALMSLPLPKEDETESEDQKLGKTIVEACLSRSFAFKLAHGLIVRVMGETLGSLWRSNPNSDNVPATYAHWLQYGIMHWTQDELPTPLRMKEIEPVKRGPLYREF